MKLLLQTFFCGWFLASVAPAVDSAKLDLSSVMKKRLGIWLQSRTKRDLSGVSAASDAAQFVRPEDVKDAFKPQSSTNIHIRAKRNKNSVSQSKRPGCTFLPTCTLHDLAHRIHKFNNKLKVDSAPIDKISPLGYGRRRRSLPTSIATMLDDLKRQKQVKSKEEAWKRQWKALHQIQRT